MAFKPVGVDENGKFPERVSMALNATIGTQVAPVASSLSLAVPSLFDLTLGRALKSALARVKLGTGRLDVLYIGDSWGEGAGASVRARKMLMLIQEYLRKAFVPSTIVGGSRYQPARANAAIPWATGIVYTGSTVDADHTGLGRRARQMTAGSTATITEKVTAFDIVYERHTTRGTFTYSIDGAAAVTVDTAGATQSGMTVRVGGLDGTVNHTLVITAVGTIVLEGIKFYNGDETTGIHVWEAAQYGWSVGRMMADTRWLTALPGLVNPDVVISAFGINDFQFTGWIVTPAQFETNYRALIDGVNARLTKPRTWFLYIPSEPTAAAANPAPWSEYRAVITGLAKSYGYGLIDGGAVLGPVKTAGAYGIGNGDGYHLSEVGHEVAARHIVASLTTKADYAA